LLWFVAAVAGVLAGADGAGAPSAGGASAEELLARALEVIDRQSARIDELTRQNTELRELVAQQGDQLAEANETIAVLQRIVSGRSSEKSGPAPDGSGDDDAGNGGKPGSGKKDQVKRGPGARSGRRDCSHLPRVEVIWISRAAGTAARSAGRRSRSWGRTCPGSSWTGRCWSGSW